MRKPPVQRKPIQQLPLKPRSCLCCAYISTLGPNDLQLHLDREHKGWAELTIKKMDIRENK